MLKISTLHEIGNSPELVEALLNDEEKVLLSKYEQLMKRAVACKQCSIQVEKMPLALENLLELNGYRIVVLKYEVLYQIRWDTVEGQNNEG